MSITTKYITDKLVTIPAKNASVGEFLMWNGTNFLVSTVTATTTDTLATVTGRVGGATTATAISLTNTTASSSTTTGALVVTGGVGIGNGLWTSGAVNMENVPTFWNTTANTNLERGISSLIYSAIASGKCLYHDEEFATGNNNVIVYNNSGGTGIVITRQADSSAPNTSGQVLKITYDGGTASPGLGGFVQYIQSRRNAVFVQRFRAKIPVGFSVMNAENSIGTGGQVYWITPKIGTGKWEEYIRVVSCGHSGTFSNSGYVYLTGTAGVPMEWYLASCSAFEVNLNPLNSLRAGTGIKFTTSTAQDTTLGNISIAPDTSVAWAFTNDTASTTTSTGALTVAGGVGVGGALYAGSLYDNGVRVSTLSFTPVQQGGVEGQGTNKVYIGWSTEADTAGNQRLKATVDLTDIGNIVFDRELNRELALKSNTTHTHNTLVVADTRNTNTLPSAYEYKLAPEFKTSTAVDLSTTGNPTVTDTYSGVIGFSPWAGTTAQGGGKAYQIALNGSNMYIRSGIDSTWNIWKTVAFFEDATHLSTANTIVKRDANAAFQANGFEIVSGTIGTNGLYIGNGDAATKTSYNMYLKGWNGMAFRTYDDSVIGVLNFRTGSFDMDGSYTGRNFINNINTGEKSYKFVTSTTTNGVTTNSAGFGMYGNATTFGFYDWENSKSFLSITRSNSFATFNGGIHAPSIETNNTVRLKGTSYSTISQELYFHSNFGNSSFTAVIYRPLNTNQLRIKTGTDNTTHVDRFTFDHNGNFTASGDVYSNSDARLKDNVMPYGSALDKVNALEPVRYQRNDLDNKKEIGFIAQAVKEVEPLLVGYDETLDIYSLDYGRVVVLLTQAVKELSDKVKKLENK
jgi:hypothetical protein